MEHGAGDTPLAAAVLAAQGTFPPDSVAQAIAQEVSTCCSVAVAQLWCCSASVAAAQLWCCSATGAALPLLLLCLCCPSHSTACEPLLLTCLLLGPVTALRAMCVPCSIIWIVLLVLNALGKLEDDAV